MLQLNDAGDAVRALQRDLNKLGSLLTIDGHYGAGTQTAVGDARVALAQPGPATTVDDGLIAALAAVLDPFGAVTAPGATFIARAEVTGARVYVATYRFPTWPSETSGITIGIGYDLQFVTAAQLRADWAGVLAEPALARLAAVTQVVGSKPRRDAVADIDVPLAGAMSVFAHRSLPAYLNDVRKIYPQVDALSAARQTALVSLVYNRGPRLTDKDPVAQDRREMRAIRDLLAANDADAVAGQFDSMTRLWDPQKLAGLVQRRRDEATLWRAGFTSLNLV
jgi:peptidoglycan hydrolase-like protein with peptidoglycan-binding domain